ALLVLAVMAQRIGAIPPVDGDARSPRDEPDHRVARQGIAAASHARHEIADALYRHARGRAPRRRGSRAETGFRLFRTQLDELLHGAHDLRGFHFAAADGG